MVVATIKYASYNNPTPKTATACSFVGPSQARPNTRWSPVGSHESGSEILHEVSMGRGWRMQALLTVRD